ncbi:hypothetical protein RHMOL_Rhmol12G0141100 [Rhododendron molle]|uniref:Uncharacterized protein n=1 Tax=Rhododendron molle TaxID=49168 RepID=A0ACC0LJ46_RHOML|nr:hypothetical protein RHMOL_Rhmol12G0141100 [Rhododendron molle]
MSRSQRDELEKLWILYVVQMGKISTTMTQLLEKCSKEVEVLKEEVKDMLVLDDVGAEKMVLIDALERLGVSYLFKK